MNARKPWYQSKTILTSIVGALVAMAMAFGLLPEDYDSAQLIGGVLSVTSVLAIIFRHQAKAEIVPSAVL